MQFQWPKPNEVELPCSISSREAEAEAPQIWIKPELDHKTVPKNKTSKSNGQKRKISPQ